MKKLFLILLFSTLYCFGQQYGWVDIGKNLPETISTVTISDVAVIGDSIWVTSGYGTYLNQTPGEIYFSTDRGATFSIQSTKYGTHAICMLDSKNGWCGGVEGQIYSTTNGGETWERRFSIGQTLMDIDFPPGCDTGICTGFHGSVKMLTKSGVTTINMQGYVSNIYSVSCIDSKHAFVAGEEIIGPITNGELQIDQSYPGTNGIYAIDMIDTLRGWCVGSPTAAGAWDSSGCMIIHTVDGHEWNEQVNPVKGKHGTLMAVKALNDKEAWIAGTSGVILHTTDGGNNWIREATGLSDEMLYGIAVSRTGEVYISGNRRTLLRYGIINGVDDVIISAGIGLSPNPATDYIDIKLPRNSNSSLYGKIKICNAMGECVQMSEDISTESFRLDISHLPAGIYFFQEGKSNIKFIKI